MKKSFFFLVMVILMAGVAQAVTADEIEATLIDSSYQDSTYLELTENGGGAGDTRDGLTLITATDQWGYPDGSDSAVTVNGNCMDEDDWDHSPSGADDFQATVTGLTPNTDYDLGVIVVGRDHDQSADFSWGTEAAGYADTLVRGFVYEETTILVSGDWGTGDCFVPLGTFTSDGNGEISIWLGRGEVYGTTGSENERTQYDGLVVLSPLEISFDPNPADGASNIQLNPDLSWTAGSGALSHDVYFGTSESAVTNAQRLAGDENGDATVDIDDLEQLALWWLSSADLEDFAAVAADWGSTADAEFNGNQPGTTYDPGTLAYNTPYYWRIDEVNAGGTITGTVWSFTTTSQLLPFTLWQLPAQSSIQMNSYVIQTYNGSIIVVDGGTVDDAPYLKNFLANLGNHVDMWFISHRHHDHIGALTVILQNPGSLQIDTIYGSMPTMSWLQNYDTNAYTQTVDFNAVLSAAGKSVTEVSMGQIIYLDGVNIKILGIKNPEFTSGNDNDQSMVMKVWDADKSVMFLGDLYINGGNKLLNTWGAAELDSDYVQMAHHGQAGVDFNVYQAISPTYCLWPTPLWLWNNDNGGGYDSGPWLTLEVRTWMDSLGVQGHYRMFDGLQTIP